jgi:hypothetical protein
MCATEECFIECAQAWRDVFPSIPQNGGGAPVVHHQFEDHLRGVDVHVVLQADLLREVNEGSHLGDLHQW